MFKKLIQNKSKSKDLINTLHCTVRMTWCSSIKRAPYRRTPSFEGIADSSIIYRLAHICQCMCNFRNELIFVSFVPLMDEPMAHILRYHYHRKKLMYKWFVVNSLHTVCIHITTQRICSNGSFFRQTWLN